ncbi:MAG: MerR family transcriptional regulator [Actinomycetia bacterium]|nr:MerR family transcriptional regulator [Actinomycetes bacterium]
MLNNPSPSRVSQRLGTQTAGLLSISQFARYTGISRSALIYYDRSGIFHPAWRDPQNNYRYYLPEQIITVNLISVLTEIGIPLKRIKELSSQRTTHNILDLFNEHSATLQEHIDELECSKKLVDVFSDLLIKGKTANIREITVETMPAWDIRVGPETRFVVEGDFFRPFLEFCTWAEEQGLNISFPIGGYFDDFEGFCARPGSPEHFFLLLDLDDGSGKEQDVLTAYSRGFYGQPGDIAQRMHAALTQKELEATGPVLNIYLEDEISVADPRQYLMLATVPVRQKKVRS